MNKFILVVLLSFGVLICFSGCFSPGFSKSGRIQPIEEPEKERIARADIKYNEATQMLVDARNNQTGEFDMAKIDGALETFKEAEELKPGDPEVHKQIGIVYEFFKNDEETAYKHYKRYKELRGSNPEILAAVEELSRKYEDKEK